MKRQLIHNIPDLFFEPAENHSMVKLKQAKHMHTGIGGWLDFSAHGEPKPMLIMLFNLKIAGTHEFKVVRQRLQPASQRSTE